MSNEEALWREIQRLRDRQDYLEALEGNPTISELFGSFLGLAALRGLWLAGDADETGAAHDISDQGRTLAYNGNPVIFFDQVALNLPPYWIYDGTGDFHSRPDEAGLDVLGSEGYVSSVERGLTVGGWFRPSSVVGTQALISKYTAAGNQRSWRINLNGTQVQSFASANGIAAFNVNSSVAVASGSWYFIVMRYDTTAATITIYVNGTADSGGGPASIFNSTAALQIGASDAGTNVLTGQWALAFLCAASLSANMLGVLFARTRALFGV